MTRLCCSILVRDPQQGRRDALRAVEHGAEMIELRLDALHEVLDEPPEQWKTDSTVTDLARLVDDLAVPVILTCRPASEGGLTQADVDTRLTLIAAVAHDVAGYADLEWRTLHHAGGWPWEFLKLSGQRPEATRIILSAHDLTGRPPNLISLFADMSESRADIVKIAWRARSVRDNIECFELLRDAAKPTVAICLGEEGLPSRVLARKFGAFMSFACLQHAPATGDGQIPLELMKRLYRWDAIRRSTRVYGVVGHPLAHSLSPHVHNAAFEASGWDGVYVPLLVQPEYESFKAFIESFLAFEPLQLTGLSVTRPHKENALRYVQERDGQIDPPAASIGAVNTIRIDREQGQLRLAAFNTDARAIAEALAGAMEGGTAALRGKRVAIIGAGGTARTAVVALKELGCDVATYNRTRARAEALAADLGVAAYALSDLPHAQADIFINATPVGQSPTEGQSPFGPSMPALTAETLVFDTIYAPTETALLRQAREAGAGTVGGGEMFLHQAAAQFRIWTSQDPPADRMRAAFLAGLQSSDR